jgi:hypothetical protein
MSQCGELQIPGLMGQATLADGTDKRFLQRWFAIVSFVAPVT